MNGNGHTLICTIALAAAASAQPAPALRDVGSQKYAAAVQGGNYMHNYYLPPAPSSTAWAPAWAPDGKTLAVGMYGSIWRVDPNTGLPTIKNDSGWVREPQRFPVRLIVDEMPPRGTVRFGSQVNVVVYTGSNPVMNLVGAVLIRIISILTYAS